MAAQSSGHPQQSPGVGDVERLRERILRDAEEQGSSKRCRMAIRLHSPQCAVLEENNDVITKEEINRRLEEDHPRGWDNRRTMDLLSNLL